jgi:hypothetical protein
MMKDDPAIKAVRDARHRISEMVGHDPRKLVEHYRQLQERHRDRLVSQPPRASEAEGENAA